MRCACWPLGVRLRLITAVRPTSVTREKTVSDPSSSEPAQLSMQEDCTLPLEERIQIRVDKYKAAGKIPPTIYINTCVKQDEPGVRALLGSEQHVDDMTIFRGSSSLGR